jgi:hypothetical protein
VPDLCYNDLHDDLRELYRRDYLTVNQMKFDCTNKLDRLDYLLLYVTKADFLIDIRVLISV